MNQLMNLAMPTTGPVVLKMSTIDIAELTETTHSSVKRSVKRLMDQGVIQLEPLVQVKNHLGQTVESYEFNRLDSITLVAQISSKFTRALVLRWDELENQVKNQPVFSGATETRLSSMEYNLSQLTMHMANLVAAMIPPKTPSLIIEKPKPVKKTEVRMTTSTVARKLGLMYQDTCDLLEELGLQSYVGGKYQASKKAEPYISGYVSGQHRWNEEIFKVLTTKKIAKYR